MDYLHMELRAWDDLHWRRVETERGRLVALARAGGPRPEGLTARVGQLLVRVGGRLERAGSGAARGRVALAPEALDPCRSC